MAKSATKTATKKATSTKDDTVFQIKVKDLLNFNRLMMVLHAVQGIIVLLISSDASRTITADFLSAQRGASPDGAVSLIPDTTNLFSIELAPLVALFFFLSSFAHFYVAFIDRKGYVANLKKGINTVRWYEYATSASLMMVLIAILSGVFDAGSLLGIFALTAVMNLMGLFMEIMNQGKKKISWLSYNVGVFAGIIPWVIVALTLAVTESEAIIGQGIPTFVFWIFVSLFVFFNSFAINMVLQYKKVGRWTDYLYGERVYMVLSLLAKSALAWQVYAGTLQPV